MTENELQEIEARAAQATAGPWQFREQVGYEDWHYIESASGVNITGNFGWEDCGVCSTPADAAFIAAAREDVPALLAEVWRLRAALDFSRIGSVTADPCFVDGCTRYGWPITAGADGAPPRVYACRGHLEQGCRSLQLPVVVVWVRELGPVRCREFGGRWHTETAIGLWETRPQRREATGDAL